MHLRLAADHGASATWSRSSAGTTTSGATPTGSSTSSRSSAPAADACARDLDDLLAEGVSGRRVLLRADLNVPLDEVTAITDDGRIRASLPTLQALRDAGARVDRRRPPRPAQGRPGPERTRSRPVAARLGELLGTPVPLAADVAGDDADGQAVAGLGRRRRRCCWRTSASRPGETSQGRRRARRAGRPAGRASADAYVDDAFGAVHRKHASVYDVATRLPHYAGRLVARELDVLDPADRPTRSGPTSSSSAARRSATSSRVIDGAAAQGRPAARSAAGCASPSWRRRATRSASSLLEADQVDTCRRLLDEAGDKIVLPVDVVVADRRSPPTPTTTSWPPTRSRPTRWASTSARSPSSRSPRRCAGAAHRLLERADGRLRAGAVRRPAPRASPRRSPPSTALSVVGGGDSAAAVRSSASTRPASATSRTGGGASLEYLEGRDLPGLAVLED